jgi:RNA polymerase sigma factor (sigma-70 family)
MELTSFIRRVRHAVCPPNSGEWTDAQVLERWVHERDELAFEVLLWRHGPMVLAVCRRILRHPQDVEDAFQATFLTLVRHARSVGNGQALSSWLYRVAYHLALRARQQAARRAHQALPEGGPQAPTKEHAVSWKELRPILDEEINRLPEHYRSAFVLCSLQGKTNEEASRELGCPVGTIQSRLHEARRRLRLRLARRGLTPATAMLGIQTSPVPPVLAEATLHGMTASASGGRAFGGVSLHILSLVEQGRRAMLLQKFKSAAVVVVAMLVGSASLIVLRQPSSAAAAKPVKDEKAVEAGLPKGWGGGSASADVYESGVDHKVVHGGKSSAYVVMGEGAGEAFGTLVQAFDPRDYRGKRLRMSAWIKTEKATEGAGLWMRIDGKMATLALDNMDGRRVKGTADWRKLEIILDVPQKATAIHFGLIVVGQGKAWVDDFHFEAVNKDVKITQPGFPREVPAEIEEMELPGKPANLDFEEGL